MPRNSSTIRLSKIAPFLAGMIVLGTLAATPTAQAALVVRMAEGPGEKLGVTIEQRGSEPECTLSDGHVFDSRLGITQVAELKFEQVLDSEASDSARYLKAARMGGGIYIHLPYFSPSAKCGPVVFEIQGRHILWNGRWIRGMASLPREEARGKSIFLTNEESPVVSGPIYLDSTIKRENREQLLRSFSRIIDFYQHTLKASLMEDVGVVAAIVHNKGGYFGFGGDALNIIRMSIDNPSPVQEPLLLKTFPSTFAHELAHKLQSERLLARDLGRYITEGSADFLKLVVLRDSGLIDEPEARQRVEAALSGCQSLANEQTWLDKSRSGRLNYREPYDCGMAYYFAAFFTSELDGPAFIDVMRKALKGDASYQADVSNTCLLFEPNCSNDRLVGLSGSKAAFERQLAWLRARLNDGPLPSALH